ncbi:hypothetical protein WMY93_006889 [Mugilogobius chulae]|uniref:Selenoprotein S n=1 Tax=Mugilogobius chulae TaxID=88201 RepID=A0AAW0PPM4_9GOBI
MADNTELPPVEQNQRPLRNEDMSAVTDSVREVLSQYGWYLLAATAVFYLLIQYIVKKYQSERRNAALPHLHNKMRFCKQASGAMEASRMRMQQELDAKAALFKEKMKQQEEEKRRQKIEQYENMKQGKSCKGNTSQTTEEDLSTTVIKRKADKKPLRSSGWFSCFISDIHLLQSNT